MSSSAITEIQVRNKIKRQTILALTTFGVSEMDLVMVMHDHFGISSISAAIFGLERDGLICRYDGTTTRNGNIKQLIKITSDGRRLLSVICEHELWVRKLVTFAYYAHLGQTSLLTFAKNIEALLPVLKDFDPSFDYDSKESDKQVSAHKPRE